MSKFDVRKDNELNAYRARMIEQNMESYGIPYDGDLTQYIQSEIEDQMEDQYEDTD